jgi:hypothetical protein
VVAQRMFSSRLLDIEDDQFAAAPSFDPQRINQHLAGRAGGKRIMAAAEVARLLNDPFATLVLRNDRFPADLTEVLAALDEHNGRPEGVAATSSFPSRALSSIASASLSTMSARDIHVPFADQVRLSHHPLPGAARPASAASGAPIRATTARRSGTSNRTK